MSPPARVAWIETFRGSSSVQPDGEVATREGGVDRNMNYYEINEDTAVATREGGVDRNARIGQAVVNALGVATREGGVDRNIGARPQRPATMGRHPRGWRG